MPVTVQQISPAQDGTTTEVSVASGEHFIVSDHALVVLDGVDGRSVAIFAPATWLSAQLDEY